MALPFTADEFFSVFAAYNTATWPAPVAAYALGVLAVGLALHPFPPGGRAVSAILGLFWLWMGLVYHVGFFARINPAAYAFGGAFVAEGVLFLVVGTVRGRLAFRSRGDGYRFVGLALIAYAGVLYPLLGALAGHAYPRAPLFGVAPCPTTIFTFGTLLLAEGGVPRALLLVPTLWSLIGGSAAILLAVPEDLGLWVVGLLGTYMILRRGPGPDATA
ncbi:MAG: hypothetical protein HY521_06125 [Proteobacteria bacterium]|nr:hypothetical protein [Pseudomonadota bacterium]